MCTLLVIKSKNGQGRVNPIIIIYTCICAHLYVHAYATYVYMPMHSCKHTCVRLLIDSPLENKVIDSRIDFIFILLFPAPITVHKVES